MATKPTKTRRLVPATQAATRLGIKEPTLRAWVASKKISHYKVGKRLLFDEVEIEKLLEESYVAAQ